MKKLKFISMVLATFALIALNSCSKDNEPGFPEEEWQTITINGQNFYNCTKAFIHLTSTYKEKKIYDRKDGHYVEIDGVDFSMNMYDKKSIEADGIAIINFNIPATAFKSGNTINGDIIDIGVTIATNETTWQGTADDRKMVVMSGTVSLTSVGNGKATVKFNNFKAQLGTETVTINGSVTCEE